MFSYKFENMVLKMNCLLIIIIVYYSDSIGTS